MQQSGGKKRQGRGRGQQKFQKGLLDAVAPNAAVAPQRSQAPKRGTPPPGGAPRRAVGRLADALARGVLEEDAAPFAQVFADRGGEMGQLVQELQGSGEPKAAMEAAFGDDSHKRLAHVVGGLAQAYIDLQKQSYAACGAAVEQALKAFAIYIGDINAESCAVPSWFVPMLEPLFTQCTRLAVAAEKGESKPEEYVKKIVEQLVVCSRKVNDKNSTEQSKRAGLLIITNHVSKLALAINNMGALTSALNNMSKTDAYTRNEHRMSLIDSASKAQRCTYYFFTGRREMLDQKFTAAEQSLSQAFALCHTDYRRNQIRILVFLLAVKLVKGKFPAPGLLEEFGLDTIFQPLVTAIKNGQVYAFDRCIEHNASFFAKLGIYVMLHRARSVCYLSALRRVHHVLGLLHPIHSDYSEEQKKEVEQKISRFSLSTMVGAMRIMNDSQPIDDDDVECALISLMSYSQVKGYYSREYSKIVLQRQNPFFN